MDRLPKSYNRIMVFGTAATSEEGDLILSDLAKRRVHRTIEAWNDVEFDRDTGLILISGGGKHPSKEKEARLMGRYLLEQLPEMPEESVLIEDESWDTFQNFLESLKMFPAFFEDIKNGTAKLALVSSPLHLKRVITIGSAVLGLSRDWAIELPAGESDGKNNDEIAAMRIALQAIEEMRTRGDS